MRIFLATYALPRPDQSSGERRFFEILRILAKKHSVDLWTCGPEPEPSIDKSTVYADQITQYGIDVHLWPEDLGSVLAKKCYDVGYFEFYWVADRGIRWFRKCQPHASIIVDSVDVHFARELLAASLGITPEAKALDTKRRELKVYQEADAVIAVSEQDHDLLMAEDASLRIGIVRNIVPTCERREPVLSQELVFVGSFQWPPNADGITWFVNEVWPLVRSKAWDATVTIIGSNPSDEIRALGLISGVQVVGYVPDTKPYLERAAISIAPLRYGGGMKGKVNEAMAIGLPVITTSIGAQGLNAVNWKHIVIADSKEDFAHAVLRLLKCPDERLRIGREGLAHNAALCSPEVAERALNDLITQVIRLRPNHGLPLRWVMHAMQHLLKAMLPLSIIRIIRMLRSRMWSRTAVDGDK